MKRIPLRAPILGLAKGTSVLAAVSALALSAAAVDLPLVAKWAGNRACAVTHSFDGGPAVKGSDLADDSLSAARPEGAAAFFRVYVTDVPAQEGSN